MFSHRFKMWLSNWKTLLRQLMKKLSPGNSFVTAATGVAAINIGGQCVESLLTYRS